MAKNQGTVPDGAKRVLVVEDEKPIARALELKLARGGVKTAVVNDGASALELIEKEKFDLILLDLVLPGVDGFSVLEEISKRKIGTSVIVISSLGQEEDFKRAKALGAEDYFVKSEMTIGSIVTRIKKLLDT